MNMIADILMAAGAFGAAIYCAVLSGRLKKFTTLETGMGGAIAVLSAQVDDMTRALDKARGTASVSAASLEALTLRAEAATARLELMIAALHDLPDPPPAPATPPPGPAPETDGARVRFVRRRIGKSELEAAE